MSKRENWSQQCGMMSWLLQDLKIFLSEFKRHVDKHLMSFSISIESSWLRLTRMVEILFTMLLQTNSLVQTRLQSPYLILDLRMKKDMKSFINCAKNWMDLMTILWLLSIQRKDFTSWMRWGICSNQTCTKK